MSTEAIPLFDFAIGEESFAIRQDGIRLPCAELRERAHVLAEELSRNRKGRVAIASSRADCVAAAVLAAQWAGCELVLLRSRPRQDLELPKAWGIAGIVDETLSLKPVDGITCATDSFHVLIPTSGTTGEPKIARHRLDALLGRIRRRPYGHERARWLLAFHPASFAGLQVLLTALVSGDELIAVSDLSVTALKEAALQWQPTHISATPTFWRSFMVGAGPQLANFPLKQITLGGEVTDQGTLDHLRAAFPDAAITHIYATTEAGAVFAVKDGRAGFPVEWLEDGIEGTRLRITNGVLEVKSPRAMAGYLASDQAAFTADGWLRTGDLVSIRGDRAHFLGRADMVMSVGGAKVTPEEVECALLQVPGVRDTRVFGVPNRLTGCVVAAEVATDAPDHDCLRRTIISQLATQIEAYKVPRIIRFVHSIPTSPTGKKSRVDARA